MIASALQCMCLWITTALPIYAGEDELPARMSTEDMAAVREAGADPNPGDARGAIMTLDTTANVPDIYAAINKELASVCDQLRETVNSSSCGDDVVSLVMAVPADTLLR